jgi:hypothetical protein
MEEALEEAYQGYLKRRGKREELEAMKAEAAAGAKRARLGGGPDLAAGAADGEGEEEEEEGARRRGKRARPVAFQTVPRDDADERVRRVRFVVHREVFQSLCLCELALVKLARGADLEVSSIFDAGPRCLFAASA